MAAWLLLTFFICLHNQLSFINFITTYQRVQMFEKCASLNRQQIVRQHTTSAGKREYFDDTNFRYLFMKLVCEITVFPLISTPGLYLISNFVSEVFIRGRRLKKRDAYFKVSKIYNIKFQNFIFQ